ncbi:hypothetical protein HSBAA_08570 [Vreelandella sulfidaeris]|uniref:Isocitrate dehydrogenase kinase/phosphatase (AceK) regulatory domain-containing protein n=1 Tax=Vreelandella sulfidaeris TaxID=115553 RepID=A0A455U4Y0_9GAMM|nr:hypothetical protein HSBAA_08570 [Halomonas sulfidaeris]
MVSHCECWREARNHYAELISHRLDFELAETFFNSLFCAIFHHRHIRNDWMFVYSSREDAAHRSGIELCRRRKVNGDWQAALKWALIDAPFDNRFADIGQDTSLGATFLQQHLPATILNADDTEIELLKSVFYRNKGAYLVGRITGGGEQVPLVLPVLHGEGYGDQADADPCLHLDTVLIETDEVSIIFSLPAPIFRWRSRCPGSLSITCSS